MPAQHTFANSRCRSSKLKRLFRAAAASALALAALIGREAQAADLRVLSAAAMQTVFKEIAAEFARLKVDVIVTAGTAPVLAAKQAATNVPIVFAVASDPVGNDLVTSLAHPGGNVTGL